MIKLIVFDLDGVLVDAKDIHYNALNSALDSIDSKYIISREDHLLTFDGLPTREKLKILTKERGLQPSLYEDIFEEKQHMTKELIIKDIQQDQHLVKLLSNLKKENLKLYVASNAIRSTVNLFLSQLGIIHLIDYIYSNEDVFESKPSPEMYLRCMIQARVKPEETIVIEDSPKGLKAAFASGAKVLRVKNSKDLTYDKIKNKIIESNNLKMQKFDYPELNIVVPMAGEGKRFQEAGYTFPKPLIEINDKAMIQVVVENLNIEANYIFLVRKEHLEKYIGLQQLLKNLAKSVTIVPVDQLTEGAACTVLLAKKYINNDAPLLIANSDQYIIWDSSEFQYMMIESKADGGILTFDATHPKWSYAKINEYGIVTEVAEKIPISNHATVGIYYWAKGSDFVKYAEQMIEKNIRTNGEFYVCPVYNEAIQDDKKIFIFDVEKMYGLGTPQDLERFIDEDIHN